MQELNLDEIREDGVLSLKAGTSYVLEIPMPSIGSANMHIDIASDYAWALFAIERLRPHVSGISSSGVGKNFPYSLSISFSPNSEKECARAVKEIADLFSDDAPDEVRMDANEFESELADTPLIALPELGDSFLANYVHGLAEVLGPDEMEERFASFPSWRFGFWKSFISQLVGCEVFGSIDGWILPRDLKLPQFLKALGWSQADAQVRLQPARLIQSGSRPWILVNERQCLLVPRSILNNAAACWQFALRADRSESAGLVFEFGEPPPGDFLSVQNESEWMVSSDGSIVTARLGDFQILTFIEGSANLRPEQAASYLAAAREDFGALANHCLTNFALDWSLMDAEWFEELCYEILVRCERFDPERMRKLGNTRSRDGGRDIEAWTHDRPGAPAEKWIYQCKFSSKPKASLSGLKTSVADVVDQFEANCYGVMTNMVIDATLYDKLDGIKRTRAKDGRFFDFQTWARADMERFIRARIDLQSEYFPKLDV